MEYNESIMSLGFGGNWGSFSIGKEFMEWGYGENGLIVLSQKAPSFPLIRIDLNSVEWLSFNYFHSWLASDVIDTSDIYFTETNSPRFTFREKYLASHTLNLKFTKGLVLYLGESIVYSDKLEILYLIPITFFKVADHYLSRLDNGAGGNSQFFIALSSRVKLRIHTCMEHYLLMK